MRKVNNKFRGNNVYSLNYKFDSVSSAGKFSGTALDLIKKYNELAKEAHSNGNYVEMEVFRQYAEHYRKIVTEINERKNQSRENQAQNENNIEATEKSEDSEVADKTIENNVTEITAEETTSEEHPTKKVAEKTTRKRRSFTVVEVAENNAETLPTEKEAKVSRRGAKRKVAEETTEMPVATAE